MKKQKHFYSHIVDSTSILVEIADMDMEHDERLHLLNLAESNIHHAVLDAILSELSEEDKIKFMEHLHSDNHDEIWKLLNSRIQNVEDKILNAADEIKKELHKDIKAVQKP